MCCGSPAFFLGRSPALLFFFLSFTLSSAKLRDSLLPHPLLLLNPLPLTLSHPLDPSQLLYPPPLLILKCFECLLVLLIQKGSVGQEANVKVLVLDSCYPWVVIRRHLNTLQP